METDNAWAALPEQWHSTPLQSQGAEMTTSMTENMFHTAKCNGACCSSGPQQVIDTPGHIMTMRISVNQFTPEYDCASCC